MLENRSFGATVTRGVLVSGFGNVAMRVLDLTVAVILLRYLSIYEFGLYRLALASFDFASGFFLSGSENVVVSDASSALNTRPREARTLWSLYIIFMGVVGVVLWAVFFFAGDIIPNRFAEIGPQLPILAFLFLLAPIETAYKLKFQILLDFAWGTYYRVARDLSRLGVIAICIFYLELGLREVLISLVVAGAVPIIIATLFYKRPRLFLIPGYAEAREAVKDLFARHGKWALLDDFVMNSSKSVRPFIVKFFAGVEAVALISVAQTLLSHVTALFPIRDVLTPVLPRLADGSGQVPLAMLNRTIKYSILGNVLTGLLGALAIPVIVYLLFPQYLYSIPLFYILLVGLPFLGFRSVALPIFYALKEQRTIFKLTILRLVLMVPLAVLLTYLLGVWGAAMELMLLGVSITPAFSRAMRQLLPGWSFPWPSFWRIEQEDKDLLFFQWRNLSRKFSKLFGHAKIET
jgi:O-antigen/teichoic acid export membrane protein